ncbi:MAG: hypothetical protein M3Q81_03670 [bacterium]|nr:hypothetical protein [bacterium]
MIDTMSYAPISELEVSVAPKTEPSNPEINTTSPDQTKIKDDLHSKITSGELSSDLQTPAFEGFTSAGGDLEELRQTHPDLAPNIDGFIELKNNQLNSQRMFFDSLNQFASQDVEFTPEIQQQFEEYMNQYEQTYQDFSGNLLTEVGLDILRNKNPVIEEWYRQRIETKVAKLSAQADQKALGFLEKIINNPDSPLELKTMAQENATALLEQMSSAIRSGETDASQAAEDLGIDTEEFSDKTAIENETLVQSTEKLSTEKGVDFLELFDLKNDKGELKRGKIATLGAVVALFVLTDQLLARAGGHHAIIPFMMDTVVDISGKMEKHNRLAKLKVENPEAYTNYYAVMGHDQDFLMNWLLDWAQKRASS